MAEFLETSVERLRSGGQGCRPWLQFFATIEGWNAAGRGVSFGTFLRIAGRETAPSLGRGHPLRRACARTPFTRENKQTELIHGLANDLTQRIKCRHSSVLSSYEHVILFSNVWLQFVLL